MDHFGTWNLEHNKTLNKIIVRIITLFLAIIIKLLPVAIAIYQKHKYIHS